MSDGNLTTKEHTEAHGDKIKGYRKLSENELTDINAVKELGQEIEKHIDTITSHGSADPRWLAMARTDLQVGIMKLVRSIAKPSSF